ncbi:hypothetical protein Leryth_024127 [Lithospermum erythrorhizon]|nr:hypothetical protein Leryth_024127 [Lithospermum erythrorhizon]
MNRHGHQTPTPAASHHTSTTTHHTSSTPGHHTGTTTHQAHPLVANKPSVRVYTKAKTDYSLTIHDGEVILAPSNPADLRQDEKFGHKVKDAEGFPSFALINMKTGEALKHATKATHPVQLVSYNPDHLDESIMWTESNDLGDNYKTIRKANNIELNIDALNGDPQHGGVHEGTKIVLWEWKKGENQHWRIAPYCE